MTGTSGGRQTVIFQKETDILSQCRLMTWKSCPCSLRELELVSLWNLCTHYLHKCVNMWLMYWVSQCVWWMLKEMVANDGESSLMCPAGVMFYSLPQRPIRRQEQQHVLTWANMVLSLCSRCYIILNIKNEIIKLLSGARGPKRLAAGYKITCIFIFSIHRPIEKRNVVVHWTTIHSFYNF